MYKSFNKNAQWFFKIVLLLCLQFSMLDCGSKRIKLVEKNTNQESTEGVRTSIAGFETLTVALGIPEVSLGTSPGGATLTPEEQRMIDIINAEADPEKQREILKKHPQYKNNRNIVLAAVKKHANALKYADASLKEDPAIGLAALKAPVWSSESVHEELKEKNEEFSKTS